jgi:hypothetical protein
MGIGFFFYRMGSFGVAFFGFLPGSLSHGVLALLFSRTPRHACRENKKACEQKDENIP